MSGICRCPQVTIATYNVTILLVIFTVLYLFRLEENYDLQEGICLPRNTIYSHYLDYCSRSNYVPINAASFGKVWTTYYSSNKRSY